MGAIMVRAVRRVRQGFGTVTVERSSVGRRRAQSMLLPIMACE
jgi:hypothetical protein